jgi:hypothetical protein
MAFLQLNEASPPAYIARRAPLHMYVQGRIPLFFRFRSPPFRWINFINISRNGCEAILW